MVEGQSLLLPAGSRSLLLQGRSLKLSGTDKFDCILYFSNPEFCFCQLYVHQEIFVHVRRLHVGELISFGGVGGDRLMSKRPNSYSEDVVSTGRKMGSFMPGTTF